MSSGDEESHPQEEKPIVKEAEIDFFDDTATKQEAKSITNKMKFPNEILATNTNRKGGYIKENS